MPKFLLPILVKNFGSISCSSSNTSFFSDLNLIYERVLIKKKYTVIFDANKNGNI